MLQAMSAFTFEIDDPDTAVAEITRQIDLKKLRAHSLGILTCSPAFIETGVVQAISEALPFDSIGCTTAGTAVAASLGELMLSLVVLTSDDLDFSIGCTESLENEQEAPIAAAWQEAVKGKDGKPAMMLVFAPFIINVGGEVFVETLSRINGGLPVFGTLAVDSTPQAVESKTFFKGKDSQTAMSFALLYGDVHPSFYVASIPDDKIQKQRGIITRSSGNILMEINNTPLIDYLKSLGLRQNGGTWESVTFPFIVDYNDGTKPVARSIYAITGEGYAVCGGFMPENATVSMGSLDFTDVIRSTSETVNTIMEQKQGSCLIMFACLYRFLMLGANTTAEMEAIQDVAAGKQEYQFSYSGGEMCPVYTGEGTTVNRFHNCTFIACRL